MEKTLNKILIIRIDALGDTVLTIPILQSIRNKYPLSKITYIASSIGAPIIERLKLADELIIIDYNKSSFKDKTCLAGKLYSQKYDVCINITEKIWGYIWAFFASSVKIGFFPGLEKPFKSMFLYFLLSNKITSRKNVHEIERYLELIKPIGCGLENIENPVVFIDENETPSVKNLFQKNHSINKNHNIGLQISSKFMSEGWDEIIIKNLIQRILDECKKINLFLIYSENEKKHAEKITRFFKSDGRLIVFESRDIWEWMSLLKKMKMLVTIDSGASHIAALIGLYCIDIFGQENYLVNSQRWHPWKSPHKLLARGKLNNAAKNDFEELTGKLTENIISGIREFCHE